MSLTLEQLLANTARTRFNLAFDQSAADRVRVYLLGCGAIGSRLGVELAKMGISWFSLQDHDFIEPANIGVQMFNFGHLGQRKIDALQSLIEQNSDPGTAPTVQRNSRRFGHFSTIPLAASVVISAVDNMATRRLLWAKWRRQTRMYQEPRLYIDPRMGFDTFEIYATVNHNDVRYIRNADLNYERGLKFTIPPANCGMEAAPYTASACAAIVASLVKSWAVDEPVDNWFYFNVRARAIQKGYELNGVKKPRRRRSRRRVVTTSQQPVQT